MPIEIMELVIKAKVGDAERGNSNSNRMGLSTTNTSEKDEKIAALERAVQESMEIIKRKNER